MCRTGADGLIQRTVAVSQAEQDEFDNAWAEFGREGPGGAEQHPARAEYVFAERNPFDGNPEALAMAQRAFQDGSLSDARLALEAVVKSNPGASPSAAAAWQFAASAASLSGPGV